MDYSINWMPFNVGYAGKNRCRQVGETSAPSARTTLKGHAFVPAAISSALPILRSGFRYPCFELIHLQKIRPSDSESGDTPPGR
jgi:hypothetical protein